MKTDDVGKVLRTVPNMLYRLNKYEPFDYILN